MLKKNQVGGKVLKEINRNGWKMERVKSIFLKFILNPLTSNTHTQYDFIQSFFQATMRQYSIQNL